MDEVAVGLLISHFGKVTVGRTMGSTGDGGSRLTMSEQSGCESTQPTVSREKRLVDMQAGGPNLNLSLCLERYSTNSSVSCLRQVIFAHEITCLPRSHCMGCFYFKSAKLTHCWFNFAVSWPRENVAEIDSHHFLRIRIVCENVAETKNCISLAPDCLYGLP